MTTSADADDTPVFAQVLVDLEPRHLDRTYDYSVSAEHQPVVGVGSRVEVVFGGRRRLGVVTGLSDRSDVAPERLRPLRRILGDHRWVTEDELALFGWAADRWASPLAHVVRHALPKRVVAVETAAARAGWYPDDGGPARPDSAGSAPGLSDAWQAYGGSRLLERLDAGQPSLHWWLPLADEDVPARAAELAAVVQARGRGVLVVTPGPRSALGDAVATGSDTADVRTAGDRAQYRAWLELRHARVRSLVGERGVAFWPVDGLGLVIVEEEAAPAHKEQRSPRHHVREVALERARRAGAICLLTGPVPSAALQGLLDDARVTPLRAARRAERQAAPRVTVVPPDPVRTRLPARAIGMLRDATAGGRYGVVLASQRGEGSALTCTRCPAMARCERCEALLRRLGDGSGRLACPRCDHQTRSSWRCPRCGHHELVALSAGAEQLGEELARTVDAPVAVLQGYAPDIPAAPAVLVLTRGSVVPTGPGPTGAVVLGDLARLAGRPRLDAGEDTLRLAMTLAGWTRQHGLTDTDVIVPALDDGDGLVRALVSWEPGLFWESERPRRADLQFPPAATIISIDMPADAPELLLDPSLGQLVSRRLDGRTRRHQLRTGDRVRAAAAVKQLLAAFSRDGITDVRVDVEPIDVT